jgi:arabinose-5-phosphate isomerase
LGNRLKTVAETMRRGADLRIAEQTRSIRDVLVGLSRPERRTGAVMLVDAAGMLTGLFTDSDLARLLEQRADQQLDQPIANVMTCGPVTVAADAMLTEALALLSQRRISELPVVDPAGRPVGLIDITDVIGLMPDVAPRRA